MRLKKGVKIDKLTPQILLGMMIADSVYRNYDRVMWITSVSDGKHMEGSKHYSGEAFDCRTWNLDNPKEVAQAIKDALGDDFDVIYEVDDRKPENSHIHCEWDPK